MLEPLVMELRQLEYFIAVVEEASFTKAAARMHVAQPGVSAQIRQLERELGVELLDRSGRSMRPTEAGVAVLTHARAAIAAVGGARLAADELAGLVRGRVAVGMVLACGALEVPTILASFHRTHPGVAITLSEANSDELIEAVRAGDLDLAWVGLAGGQPAGIATHVIVEENLIAAVHPSDPLAKRSRIRLAELRDRSLISMPRGTGLRACLDDACTSAGFTPQIALEAGAPHILAALASQNLGIAILPASVAAEHQATLHTLTIGSPRLQSRIELAWRAEGTISPAARALIAHARAFVSRGQPAA